MIEKTDQPELSYPTAILLDWDGTIYNSLPKIHDVITSIGAEMGLPPITYKQIHDATIYGRRSGEVVFGLEAEQSQKFWEMFSERFFVFDGQVTLLEHASDFVTSIPETIPIGIISNNRKDVLDVQIVHLGWGKRFGAVIAASHDPAQNKPNAAPALKALEQLGISPSREVWFVGDTRGDIECAHAAGLTSILLAPVDAKDCKPHYWFVDCRPLQKHLAL